MTRRGYTYRLAEARANRAKAAYERAAQTKNRVAIRKTWKRRQRAIIAREWAAAAWWWVEGVC